MQSYYTHGDPRSGSEFREPSPPLDSRGSPGSHSHEGFWNTHRQSPTKSLSIHDRYVIATFSVVLLHNISSRTLHLVDQSVRKHTKRL